MKSLERGFIGIDAYGLLVLRDPGDLDDIIGDLLEANTGSSGIADTVWL